MTCQTRSRDWVDALDVGEPVTPDEARARAVAADEHRGEHRRRRGVLAAAVLVLLVSSGVLVRSGLDDDAVTTGPPPTLPIPRDLDELADRVAALPTTTVLGETDDARYTYRRAHFSVGVPTSEMSSYVEELWVDRDGSGRTVVHAESSDPKPDDTVGPGTFTFGMLPPHAVLELTDDVDAVATALATVGVEPLRSNASPLLVEILTYAGLPSPARAGVLRTLDRIGFVPVPGADVGPDLMRVEGPDTDESRRMQVDLNLLTGEAVAWERMVDISVSGSVPTPVEAGVQRFRSIEVGLRPDARGS